MSAPRPRNALADRVPGTAWMADAACLDRRDLPWTTDTMHLREDTVARMAAVCAACPVWTDCVEYAAVEDMTGGYWAGADRTRPDTPRRRARTARSTRKAAA